MAGQKGRRSWGWIARQRSKRYLASYIGPDLVRHYAHTTFETKMNAEHWLAEERRLIELKTWTPPAQRQAFREANTITLAQYAATWIEQRPLKARTRSMYEDLVRLHIKDTIGKVPVGSLTGEAVRTWFAKLDKTRPRANSHAYGLLHAICGTAVKDGLLQANPCHIERAMNPPRKREPVVLTIAELATVADKIAPESLKALVLLSAWCGVRWGEVVELRRKDIDKDCEVLYVSRAVTHRGGCTIDTPKTGKPRAVVIPPHIRADLRHHLDTYVAKDPEAQLFAAARGGCHLNEKVVREHLAPALKAAGREGVRIHDLRHFAGTQVARVGNLVETMARLGHTTVKASLIYQQVVSGRDAEIAAALSELAQGQAGTEAQVAENGT